MLTTSHRSFPNSCAIETGLPDFHKDDSDCYENALSKKKEPIVIQYRD